MKGQARLKCLCKSGPDKLQPEVLIQKFVFKLGSGAADTQLEKRERPTSTVAAVPSVMWLFQKPELTFFGQVSAFQLKKTLGHTKATQRIVALKTHPFFIGHER